MTTQALTPPEASGSTRTATPTAPAGALWLAATETGPADQATADSLAAIASAPASGLTVDGFTVDGFTVSGFALTT